MDLEKFENMIKLVLRDLSQNLRTVSPSEEIYLYSVLQAKVSNVISIASKILPEHQEFFNTIKAELNDSDTFSFHDAHSSLEHILKILEIEKAGETKIKEMKIFESAEEKLRQAGLSFRNSDYPSTFNNLNTALELILKDKCGIPTTITDINTSNVIELLVKYKVEPYAHFSESRKRVTDVANRVKHQAYVPSKKEAILGIRAMEELISKLRDKEIKLTKEIKDKIFQGL